MGRKLEGRGQGKQPSVCRYHGDGNVGAQVVQHADEPGTGILRHPSDQMAHAVFAYMPGRHQRRVDLLMEIEEKN